MNKRYLWVVEIKKPGGWIPSHTLLSRSSARDVAKVEQRNWSSVTRIRKYMPEDAK